MDRKFNYFWLLLLLPVGFLAWYLFSETKSEPLWHLPYYGPKNAVKKNDTIYHVIPPFRFTDQNGQTVDERTTAGKIYVAEYFFTTCQSICPVMNDNLEKVHAMFRDRDDFMILSHTVDPETDSVPVLKAYAESHGADDASWRFLTGSKASLYELARKGYLLDAAETSGGPEDFIHTQNFALVDKEKRIRGYYDGTDSLEQLRMIKEIKLLMQEYDHKTRRP